MQWQFLPITFTQGLSQKADDKQITNQWLKLENVVMEKTGKFQKRRGFTKGDYLASAKTIVSSGADGTLLPLATDPSLQFAKFLDLGMLTKTQNQNTGACSISRTGEIATMYANDETNNVYRVYFRKFDTDTQRLLTETTGGRLQINATYQSQFAGVSDTTRPCFVIVADVDPIYQDPWGGSPSIVVWDNGNLIPIETGIGPKKRLNMSAHGNGNYIFIAYSDIDAGNTKVVRYNLTSQTVDASTTIAKNNLLTRVAAGSTDVWVSIGNTLYKRDYALTAVSSAVNSNTISQLARDGSHVTTTATQCSIYNSSLSQQSTWQFMTVAPVQPFTVGGAQYAVLTQLPLTYPEPWPGSYFFVRMNDTDNNITASCLFSFVSSALAISQPKDGMIPLPTSSTYRIANVTTGVSTDAISINGDLIYSTIGLRYASGSRSFMYGFPQQPPKPSVSAGAGGSGTLAAGTYQVVNLLEAVTPAGNVIRSAPSIPVEVTVAANGSINVASNIPATELSNASAVTYSVYIKAPGASLFRSTKRFLAIGASAAVTEIPIDAVDLYTEGAFEDIPAPAIYGGVSLAKNRIWCFSAESNAVYFSDPIIPGELPLFIEGFSLALPQAVGDGTSVTELDGKIIVFQQYAVSATFGDGPDQLGANPFPALQIIARDIGAINAKSVVTTNDGVFFLSSKGLWMIDRGLTVQYLGAAVEDGASGILCGAKLTDTEQVWFFSTNTAYIFDMYHKLWTTAPLGFSGVTSCKVIKNKLEVVASGYNYTMTGTSDDNGSITVKLTSGWMSLAGLQGFARFRRLAFLADAVASNTMTVTLRYDFSSTDFETFTVASASVLTSGTTAQWIIRPKRQKCEAMQIEISYTGTNSGVSFSGFSMEVGRKDGVNKMAMTNRIGGN